MSFLAFGLFDFDPVLDIFNSKFNIELEPGVDQSKTLVIGIDIINVILAFFDSLNFLITFHEFRFGIFVMF